MVGTSRTRFTLEGDLMRSEPPDMGDVRMAMAFGRGVDALPDPEPMAGLVGEDTTGSVTRCQCRGDLLVLEILESVPMPPMEMRRLR